MSAPADTRVPGGIELGPRLARAARVRASVLDAVGDTPLVRLSRLYPELDLELYAKLEALNPGGSLKDRAALRILQGAMADGVVGPDTVVVESSSGNMGVGLAQACRYLGLRFICVVDPRTTGPNVALLQAYGAQVDMVCEPDPASGEFLQARLARVRELMAQIPDSFWPDQFANMRNPEAHLLGTMAEIDAALDGNVDYVFCATSTCGTLRGCAEYVRARGRCTRVVAVDAAGSAIFGGPPARRVIPGLGAGLVPALFSTELADLDLQVSSVDCIAGCRLLVEREAILAGGSGGGLVTAVRRLAPRLRSGARCVLVLCDRGERYLDTIFSDAWVAAHFGEIRPIDATPEATAI